VDDVEVEVEVADRQVADLAQAATGVPEEADDRGVAAGDQVAAVAASQDLADEGERDLLLGDGGGFIRAIGCASIASSLSSQSNQRCTARYSSERTLDEALELVGRRFTEKGPALEAYGSSRMFEPPQKRYPS
jgi:hypothetical protein